MYGRGPMSSTMSVAMSIRIFLLLVESVQGIFVNSANNNAYKIKTPPSRPYKYNKLPSHLKPSTQREGESENEIEGERRDSTECEARETRIREVILRDFEINQKFPHIYDFTSETLSFRNRAFQ